METSVELAKNTEQQILSLFNIIPEHLSTLLQFHSQDNVADTEINSLKDVSLPRFCNILS